MLECQYLTLLAILPMSITSELRHVGANESTSIEDLLSSPVGKTNNRTIPSMLSDLAS